MQNEKINFNEGCKQIENTLSSLVQHGFEKEWYITQLHIRLLEYAQGQYNVATRDYIRVLIQSCPFIFPEIKQAMIEDMVETIDPRISGRKYQEDPQKYFRLLKEQMEKAQSE